MHDYNGGIPPSGLFWTVELPQGAFSVSRRQKRARLHLRDLPLIDTFTFFGPSDTPAVLSMTIEWEALEDPVDLGSGAAVPPDRSRRVPGPLRKGEVHGALLGPSARLQFSFRPWGKLG